MEDLYTYQYKIQFSSLLLSILLSLLICSKENLKKKIEIAFLCPHAYVISQLGLV